MEQIVLPCVAFQLGSGWEAEGLALSAPDGQEFAICVNLLSPPPKILVGGAQKADGPFDQIPLIELPATATPDLIASAPRGGLRSQGDDGSGSSAAVSAAESTLDSDPRRY